MPRASATPRSTSRKSKAPPNSWRSSTAATAPCPPCSSRTAPRPPTRPRPRSRPASRLKTPLQDTPPHHLRRGLPANPRSPRCAVSPDGSGDERSHPMVHKVKGAVVRSKNAPVTLETILVPDPGPGEALVDILTCGVCHTDLHYKQGAINDDFPFLLGHEATGVVSAVGPDVTEVAPGDRVVLNWRAVCGECRACRRGQPQYCFN